MSEPDYYLADLPAGAVLTPEMIRQACDAIRSNRRRHLAGQPLSSLIDLISTVSQRWLDHDFPLRRRALDLGPGATGFSRAVLEAGLDALFASLTADNLETLVLQDLGAAEYLDSLTQVRAGLAGQNRAGLARGPELLVHIAGGTLPNPAIMSLVLGLLTRSAQFMKCAGGTSLLPRLFAHSIHQEAPTIGACIEIAEWRGGDEALESELLAQADCVTATGRDETVARLRTRTPVRTRFLGYGHKVSFAYVAKDVLTGLNPGKHAVAAAADIVAWDQQGCLSPHVIYVQQGAALAPEQFAEALAKQLEARERTHPRGRLEPAAAASIATRRSFYKIRAAHELRTRMWCSPESTAWTVVYEDDPRFAASCLNRFVYVKPVEGIGQMMAAADVVRHHVSTIGIAVPDAERLEIANALARWGASRVCPLGRMQQPPPAWRHDGRPCLADLLTWTDLEF